jgi:hypothetical protein
MPLRVSIGIEDGGLRFNLYIDSADTITHSRMSDHPERV